MRVRVASVTMRVSLRPGTACGLQSQMNELHEVGKRMVYLGEGLGKLEEQTREG